MDYTRQVRQVLKWVVGLPVWVLLFWGVGYCIYVFADSEGQISHDKDAMLTMTPNWVIGETKECTSMTTSELRW